MNNDGSNVTRITNNEFTGAHPAWSPNGEKIAFYSCRRDGPCDIYMMNIDGSEPKQLSVNEYEEGWDTLPAWSPDSRRIAFTSSTNQGGTPMQILVVDINSGEISEITELMEGVTASFPYWSPNGEKIIFRRCSSDNGEFNCNTFIMNTDGSEQEELISDSGRAVWKP